MTTTTAHDRRREERRRLARLVAEFADAPAPPPDLSVMLLAAAAVELYGGTTALLDAATVAHIDAGTRLRLTASGGSVEIIGPSQADQIETLLDQYNRLLLLPGTYAPTAPIDIPSGKSLIAPWGQAVFVPAWSPDVGDADARTNYVIGVQSTLGGATTTLGATMKCGSRTLTLASTTGIAANDWLILSGHNGGDDELLMSDGASVIVRELVQVATVDSGTGVTLQSRTRQHHATGKSVYRIGTMVQDVTIRGISARAPGGTIGIGIACTYARNVRIEDYEIEGLSRAGVDMFACEDFRVDGLYSHGEVNSWVRAESCIGYTLTKLRGTDNGLREHANGKPKALVDQRGRCKGGLTTDAHFIRGNFSYRDWGGQFCGLTNAHAEDMDPTEALARDTEFVLAGNLAGGLAWDGGAGDVATWAAFGIGAYCDNYTVDASSMYSAGVYSSTEPQVIIYLHDHFRVAFSNLVISNRGTRYETTPGFVSGIDMRDCTGVMTNVLVSGCHAAMSTRNVYGRIKANNVELDGVVGTSGGFGNASWGYVMGAVGLSSEVEFNGVTFTNWNGTEFEVGPEVTTASADWNLNWRNVNFDGYRAEYVTLARNDSGTPFTVGQIGMYDDAASAATGSTARMIDTPTAAARGVGVVLAQDHGDKYCLFAPLPQMVSAGVDGAVALGGMLAATTGRALTSTATLADACARATRKLSGVGIILVGGV